MEAEQVVDLGENPTLKEAIDPENDLKNMLVEYVGEKINPEDSNVTIEMVINVMAEEFPEFLMAIAEENFIRGYHQALVDVDTGKELYEKELEQKEKSDG